MFSTRILGWAGISGLLLLLGQPLPSSGQGKPLAPGEKSPTTMGKSDQRFLVESAMDSLAEASLGQLGVDQAQNQEVKKFAQRMVTDHTNMLTKIKELAAEQQIHVPNTVDPEHTKIFAKLSRAQGSDFDTRFVAELIREHEKDVKTFEKASTSVQDPQIKSWVQETLPALQSHLKEARDLKAQLSQGTG